MRTRDFVGIVITARWVLASAREREVRRSRRGVDARSTAARGIGFGAGNLPLAVFLVGLENLVKRH